MQCIHFVKVEPIIRGEYLTLKPHHYWLQENGITQFRGGHWPYDEKQMPRHITFRFANIEDAMAFKLRWCE